MKNIYKIEFSIRNILLILGMFITLFLLWKLQIVVFMFFFAFILSSALRPLVENLKNRGIPRALSVVAIYLLTFVVFGFIVYLVGAVIVDQVDFLSNNANSIITDVIMKVTDTFPGAKNALGLEQSVDLRGDISKEVDEFFNSGLPSMISKDTIGGASSTIVSTIGNVAAILFGAFTVLIVSAYMTNSEEKFYKGFISLIPSKHNKKIVLETIEKVELKLGAWFVGQVLLMLIIGFLTLAGLELPGLFFDTSITQYAVPIALIAGILESVPSIGPTITWFIAIIIMIGSNSSPVEIAYVAIILIAIQQLEAILIVPIIMKKAIGIDPIVTILGLIAATTLFGVIGAILVLPMIATFQIIFEEVIKNRSNPKVAPKLNQNLDT